jgi:UDP:flavonoid glycosyltransferase YjiC (YdhE family)
VSEPNRVICASVAATGHFLPMLALARELRERGNEVAMLAPERGRETVEGLALRFVALEEPATGNRPGDPVAAGPLAAVARSAVPLIQAQAADVVVTDPFAQAPMLAAEAAGTKIATLMPDPYHVPIPGLPVFAQGMLPPRTALGTGAWLTAWPLAQRARRRMRGMFNELRGELDLPPLERLDGVISDGLAMVATFPQLEYPRNWPANVEVTGPMLIDLPGPIVDPPPGTEPLVVVVASTTGLESPSSFVRIVLKALEAEPVRVVATVSHRGGGWCGPIPGKAVVVDWLDLAALLPAASAVVCNGGHGTVARALAEGVPTLVCPMGGNTPQTGVRVTWAGAGLMVPRRLLGPRSLRWAVRRLLADSRMAERARSLATWGRANHGPTRGAELVERYARR